jgi:hypothetical protein
LLTLVEHGETVVNEPAACVYHALRAPERLRDLDRCRIAYLLYILMTRPQLRWRLITSLIERSQRKRSSLPGARPSVVDLLMDFIGSPARLLAAMRIDLATVRRSVPGACGAGAVHSGRAHCEISDASHPVVPASYRPPQGSD